MKAPSNNAKAELARSLFRELIAEGHTDGFSMILAVACELGRGVDAVRIAERVWETFKPTDPN